MRETGRQPALHINCACRLAVLVALLLATASAIADKNSIQELLDQADRPGFTILNSEDRQLLERLLVDYDHATPRQQTDIRLIQARNVALAGDFGRGIEILSTLVEQKTDADQQLRALELLANMLLQTDRYHEAFSHLMSAVDLAEEVESAEQQGRVYSLAAYWYAELGATDQARQLARLVDARIDEMQDPWQACITLEKLGLAQRTMNNMQAARLIGERALSVCAEAGDPIYISATHALLGEIHARLGNTEQAKSLMTDAIELAEKIGYIDGQLLAQVALARLLIGQQRHAEAEELLMDSLEAIESRQRWRHLKDARRLLGRIAQAQGDLESAHHHYTRYLDAHDRYLWTLRSRAVAFHEVRLGAREREQELQVLREQTQLDELESLARRQRWGLQMVSFGLISLLVAVLILLTLHTVNERRHFRTLSRRDSLSGLYNHTSFLEESIKAMDRNQSSPVTMVVGDIDHFKRINDTYGHLVGDEVIRRVASRLQEAFGNHGIVGRIGGEEFAIMLPGKRVDFALELVEELRRALNKTRRSDSHHPVTISFGLAEAQGATSVVKLREAADEALYAAKRAGRDQVSIAGRRASGEV